jgi:nitronate monooxygenase
MNWTRTPLTEGLGICYPIIQAPMAGGATTPALVAAVSNAGGLGSLGAGYLEPEAIRSAITEIRSLTDKPFAVNLFIQQSVREDTEQITRAYDLLEHYRRELELSAAEPPKRYLPNFKEQLAVILEEAVPALSFTFGVPQPEELEVLRQREITTIGTATHLLEAIVLEESGVDMIVAQGFEAGGHRGTFAGSHEHGLVGTLTLVPLLADQISVPVVAAGGIMDGRGIVAALALGAAGVQMGTAFLACPESGANPKYKEAVCGSTEIDTVLTRVFSGKYARGIKNRLTQELQPAAEELPDYPIQHALTSEIRQTAARSNRPEFMSLWAGQGCPLISDKPAAELIADWVAQVGRLTGRPPEG